NDGGTEATGVAITETVPENTTFNATASTGGWTCADGVPAGSSCDFHVGTLAAGANGVVVFAVNVDDPVPGGTDEVENTASIADDGANGADANPDDNTATETPTIATGGEVDLTVAKSGPPTAAPGGGFSYTVTVTNEGGATADDVTVADTLPNGLTFDDANS